MPRKVDPGSIRTGSGKTVPAESPYSLGGVVPGSPTIGYPEYDGPKPEGGAGGLAGLDAHIHDPSGAHPASAISVSPFPDLLLGSRNVEQSLDGLTSGMPPQPTMNGILRLDRLWSTVPVWGMLDLGDSNLVERNLVPGVSEDPYEYPPAMNNPDDVYPYFFAATAPTLNFNGIWQEEPEYDTLDTEPAAGEDLRGGSLESRDLEVWNVSTVRGGGQGEAYAGAFTDVGDAVRRTTAALPLQPPGSVGPGPDHFPACMVGNIFPADRGVLALIRWPHNGDVADFLAEDLLDRVVAAILLGQGITGGDCIRWDESIGAPLVCDGDPGGIFAVGTDENGNYDPMAYPGQATGQYNLDEIFTGVSTIAPEQLPPPWNDFDGDGNVGAPRHPNSEIPAPGQVRLGTVAEAICGEPPKLPYGIPILGAGPNAYEDYTIHAGMVDGVYAIGLTFLETSNFFSYRLPVMASYSRRTGIRFTPRGIDPLTTKETARYFFVEEPFDNGDDSMVEEIEPGVWVLRNAGGYTWGTDINVEGPADAGGTVQEGVDEAPFNMPFLQDAWLWQLAKYRHSFYVLDSDTKGAKGTYWFFHFKQEEDFEKFVRDGIMPWDATDGYELYGAYPNAGAIEDYGNLVNEDDGTGVNPHMAPQYGYKSLGYFLNRSSIYVADEDHQDDIVFTTHTWMWADAGTGGEFMACSGVTYFIPNDAVTAAPAFSIDTLTAVVTGGGVADPWTEVYRTDDNPMSTGDVPPAQVSSPDPALLYLGHFSYDDVAGVPTMTVTPGFTDARGVRPQRIEFPYTHLGAFSEVVGPLFGDNLTIQLAGGETIVPDGDDGYPAFTINARPRAFVRRPLAHATWQETVQPTWAAGGAGAGQALDATDGREVLFHSTAFTTAGGGTAPYGNFTTGAVSPAYASLATAGKDTEERFLDEVYRYTRDFAGVNAAAGGDQLRGPGMAAWAAGLIEVPVRAGHTVVAPWDTASWVQLDRHETVDVLDTFDELQVAGMPDRNPPLSDWAIYAAPSAGRLMYPKEDYTAGYAPGAGEGITQSDYSTTTGDKEYVRCFDVAFSNATEDEDVVGSALVTFRIDGLKYNEFGYAAPGPGHPTHGIAIMVKVPGLTTWMDLGRNDGGGPSKQDPVRDGAGCRVLGEYTYDYYDQHTGQVYCQVRANVGPAATLQASADGTVPILVKVIMKDGATSQSTNFDFWHERIDPAWTGTTGPGISPYNVRGISGIQIIRESEKAALPTPPVTT